MFKRQTSGSIVCPSCGNLVGVNDDRCYICGRRNPGLWGFAPVLRRLGNEFGFVPLVIGGSVALYVVTLIASGPSIRMSGPLSFLAPSGRVLFLFGGSGAFPVFELGRWWTVASAGWLHANLLHILFNMLWVRQLAPPTSEVYGGSRMIIIYTIAGVCGFALSSAMGEYLPLPLLGGAGFTVGASASIFGLLGALVHYGRRGGSSLIGSQAWSWAIILFIFGAIMPGVDNYAHAGGFAGGYLASRWLDPLRPERVEHLLGALACVVVTLAAILWSVVTGWALLS
jgi:rhomboid protease GluP